MNCSEIKLGEATYEIVRVYEGTRSLADLVKQILTETSSFDGSADPAVQSSTVGRSH